MKISREGSLCKIILKQRKISVHGSLGIVLIHKRGCVNSILILAIISECIRSRKRNQMP